MEQTVVVRLRDTGQNFTYKAQDIEVKENDYVIVEHDRGLDYGQIISLKGEAEQPEDGGQGRIRQQQPPKRIVRVAREADLKQIEDNRARSKEAFSTCQKKIAEHKLEMKLVQAEYSFDRSKIIFYFTSGGRVDFRNLVKDLAKIFKARIELRQIGVRDETRFFGGFGPCGRELCCATFLKDFEPVTIKMAKEEGLPLNPPKISGICGRLMCCLNYEYETYKMLSKGLPREGERIMTAEGKGKVININVFKRLATVELEDGKFITVNYNEKPPATAGESPAQERKPESARQERPERPPQRQESRHRQERQERPGRPDGRPERGQRQEQQQYRDRRHGNNRPDQRNERQNTGRPDQRNDRQGQQQRPGQQKYGQQQRPGQDRNFRDRPRNQG